MSDESIEEAAITLQVGYAHRGINSSKRVVGCL